MWQCQIQGEDNRHQVWEGKAIGQGHRPGDTMRDVHLQTENIRRRHNYLPFIMELLKILAQDGKLVSLVDKVSFGSFYIEATVDYFLDALSTISWMTKSPFCSLSHKCDIYWLVMLQAKEKVAEKNKQAKSEKAEEKPKA